MSFEITPDVDLNVSEDGRITALHHAEAPFVTARDGLEPAEMTARALADEYLSHVAPHYGFDDAHLARLDETATAGRLSEEECVLKFAGERTVPDMTTVFYEQTCFGLPVWQSSVAVHVDPQAMAVVGSTNLVDLDLEVRRPDFDRVLSIAADFPREALVELFRLDPDSMPEIEDLSLVVYRFDPERRSHRHDGDEHESYPELPLPELPRAIEAGAYYVAFRLCFKLDMDGFPGLTWEAFLEAETAAVLRLRPLVHFVAGAVFALDPVTQGDNKANAKSGKKTLNPQRSTVPLLGLDAPAADRATRKKMQSLKGEFVAMKDELAPHVTPPKVEAGKDFLFDATSDDFTAVNAYVHLDACFRLMENWGFQVRNKTVVDPKTQKKTIVKGYYDRTTFPIPVDPRGESGALNAHWYPNAKGGTEKFTFGLVGPGSSIGIATTRRVVQHEFGHSILGACIDEGSFDFAHGVGDSFAAILNDPQSLAKNTGETFPFVRGGRFHDRKLADGWAWYGTQLRQGAGYNSGYLATQVMSTCLFRAYRSTGGASPLLSHQVFASEYTTYLIMKACALLGKNISDPAIFVSKMMLADKSTIDFMGNVGGTSHKVMRWSFEQQGLYQKDPAKKPYTTIGQPPNVDVYVDDGRQGGYQYTDDWQNSADVWNRRSRDGGTENQDPLINQPNFLYVRVKNRGTGAARNVKVSAYQQTGNSDFAWPAGWKATTTAFLSASEALASQGETVLGPFEWTPDQPGSDAVLVVATADGDKSCVENAKWTGKTVPHWRFVPFDNNNAQRNFSVSRA